MLHGSLGFGEGMILDEPVRGLYRYLGEAAVRVEQLEDVALGDSVARQVAFVSLSVRG